MEFINPLFDKIYEKKYIFKNYKKKLNHQDMINVLSCLGDNLNEDILKQWIEEGNDINDIMKNDLTFLHYCVLNTYFNKTNLLLKYGANPNSLRSDGSNKTPFHIACKHRDNNIDIINLLYQSGANPNLQDLNGQTALHSAVYYMQFNNIKFLIENTNMDIYIKNKWNENAFEYITEFIESKKHLHSTTKYKIYNFLKPYYEK